MESIKLVCAIAFFILSLGSFVTGYTYFTSKNGELRIIMYKKFWCCAIAFFCVGVVMLIEPYGPWMIKVAVPFIPYGVMKLRLFKYITKG